MLISVSFYKYIDKTAHIPWEPNDMSGLGGGVGTVNNFW
jgi:hypothetical protein